MPRFFRYENSGRRGKMRSLNRPLCVFGIFARSRGNGALFSRRVVRQRSTVFQDKEERFTKLQLAMILKIFRQRTLACRVGPWREARAPTVFIADHIRRLISESRELRRFIVTMLEWKMKFLFNCRPR